MQAYMCTVCGFLYGEQSADKNVEGKLITFEELDAEWKCPICGVPAEVFKPVESERIPDVPTQDSEK